MKKLIGFAVLAMVISPFAVSSEENTARDNSSLAAASLSEEPSMMDTGKMQEKMLRMHEQMHKIMRTKEGIERERLLQEHRMMIEENMRMMHGMMGATDRESVNTSSKDM